MASRSCNDWGPAFRFEWGYYRSILGASIVVVALGVIQGGGNP